MSYLRFKKGARIRDVAEAAGVSKTTVSLVVNGLADKVGISLATRQRVEATVRELGYIPSPSALAMATGRVTAVTVEPPAPALKPMSTVSTPIARSPAEPVSVSPSDRPGTISL